MKILLIEDDVRLADNVSQYLRKHTYVVEQAHTLEEAQYTLDVFGHELDCILLDVMLPDGNGIEFCRQLREQKITTPIIIMTARDALDDRVAGLDNGADDYLTKPFAQEELVARIRAVIRRNSPNTSPILTIDTLVIHPAKQHVSRNGRDVELTSKEFAVLEYLARHQDEVVTRTMIMEHVWGSDFETLSNVVDVYIRNLRRKIDSPPQKKLLHTIRGSGYCLSELR